MTRTANWGVILLLIGALAVPGIAQNITDQKEYDAYKAVFDEKDQAKKAALAEKFLVDFPKTDAKTQAYTMMVLGFAQAGNWAKALEKAELLGQFAPNADNNLKGIVYQVGLAASQQLKNSGKIVEYAEKILALNPNELNALIALSGSLSSTLPTAEPARDAQLTKSLDITNRALKQPRPTGVPDAQWSAVQLQLNRTVCQLLLNKKQYAEAIAACDAALKVDRKDAGSYYLMGLALKYQVPPLQQDYLAANTEYNANRAGDPALVAELKAKMDALFKIADDKLGEAIDAFAKSVAIGGVAEAKTELENLYKGRNNDSLAGLDQLIAQKKSEIGD